MQYNDLEMYVHFIGYVSGIIHVFFQFIFGIEFMYEFKKKKTVVTFSCRNFYNTR